MPDDTMKKTFILSEMPRGLFLELLQENKIDYAVDEDQNKRISFSEVDNIPLFFHEGGRAIINEELLKTEIGKHVIARYINDYVDLKIELNAGEATCYKMTTPTGVGCYTDLIALASLEASPKINHSSVKRTFFNISTTLCELAEVEKIEFPIEINSIILNEAYSVEFTFRVNNQILSVLVGELIKILSVPREGERCSIVFLQATKDGTFRLELFWMDLGEKVGCTWLLNDMISYSNNTWVSIIDSPSVCKTKLLTEISNKLRSANINEQLYKLATISDPLIALLPYDVIMLLDYIKGKIKEYIPEIDREIISYNELENILKQYKDQNRINSLTIADKDFILRLVQNIELEDIFRQQYDEELNNIVKMEGEFTSDQVITIVESCTDRMIEEIIRVTGNYDRFDSDEWKRRRLEFINDLREKDNKISFDSIGAFAKKHFLVEDSFARDFSKMLYGKSFNTQVGEVIHKQLDDLFKVCGDNIGRLRDIEVIEEQEQSITRMRRLISRMKVELLANKTVKSCNHELSELENKLYTFSKMLSEKELKIRELELNAESQNCCTKLVREADDVEVEVSYDQDLSSDVEDINVMEELPLKVSSDEIEDLKNKLDDLKLSDNSKKSKLIKLENENNELKDKLKLSSRKNKMIESKLSALQLKATSELDNKVAEAIKVTEKKFELKFKQLEMMNDKLTKGSQKAQNELISKKQDVIKYKAENTALKNQIVVLERKLKIKAA